MCLHITRDNDDILKKTKERNKPILGYKVLEMAGSSYVSIYRNKTWRKNKTNTYISNRKTSEMTEHEKIRGNVFKGFHFYKTRDIARKYKGYGAKIVQFEIDPKDIVAFGNTGWGSSYYSDQFVATRCKMIKEVR